MKKVTLFLLISLSVVLCAFAFASCSDGYSDANITRISNGEISGAALMKSGEDIDAYAKAAEADGGFADAMEKIKSYKDEFFNDNMVIFIVTEEISSSNELSVNKIEYEGDTANIILKRKTPKIATDEVARYFIAVEIPKNDGLENVGYTVK